LRFMLFEFYVVPFHSLTRELTAGCLYHKET
jgi:hypothetical protein